MTKSKDRYSRLGFGKEEPLVAGERKDTVQGHFVSRYSAAWLFLDAVAKWYPNVLEDLDRFLGKFPEAPQNRARQLEEIEWLQEWCLSQRLDSALVLRAAWKTTSTWRQEPKSRRRKKWAFPETDAVAPDVPDARQKTLQRDSAHFVWLADYVVGHKNYSSIANEVGRSVPTVREALVTLADMIELKLPAAQRGRPRR